VVSNSAGAAVKYIEILLKGDGVPTSPVTLHGDAKLAPEINGVGKVLVSLSHFEVSFIEIRPADGILTLVAESVQTVAITLTQACTSSSILWFFSSSLAY
jgi:hypothetical protein